MPQVSDAMRRLVGRVMPGRLAAGSASEKAALERERDKLIAEHATLEAEQAELGRRRRALQEQIGVRMGKRVQTRDKFEKTRGLPSLLVSHGSWERIWDQTVELQGGRDEARDVFADPASTASFLSAHGVPAAPVGSVSDVVVHTFRDRVALIDIGDGAFQSVDADGVVTAVGSGEAGRLSTDDPRIAVMVASSARLGGAIPRPYVQVGWSLAGNQPTVVKVDVSPETIAFVDHDTDRVLGDLHELALVKIQQALVDRGALDIRVPGGTFIRRSAR